MKIFDGSFVIISKNFFFSVINNHLFIYHIQQINILFLQFITYHTNTYQISQSIVALFEDEEKEIMTRIVSESDSFELSIWLPWRCRAHDQLKFSWKYSLNIKILCNLINVTIKIIIMYKLIKSESLYNRGKVWFAIDMHGR